MGRSIDIPLSLTTDLTNSHTIFTLDFDLTYTNTWSIIVHGLQKARPSLW